MRKRRLQLRPQLSRSLHERRRKRLWIGAVAALLGLVFWGFFFVRLASLEDFLIEDVQVNGADADILPAIRSAAYRSIQGSYLGLFPKSDIFIYPHDAVAAAVVRSASRIVSAKTGRDGLHTLTIAVVEKDPAALVCADLPNFDDSGALAPADDCYAADASGLVFKRMATISTSTAPTYDRLYVPSLSDASAVGSFATTTAEFRALRSFMAGAKAAGIKAEGVLLKDGGEYELYADNPAGLPGGKASTSLAVVYLNDRAGFASELSDLTAFWSNMVASSTADAATLEFEYVDLRYAPSVFYRLAK